MISLLLEKWIPIRRKSGLTDWISPDQITEPDITAFAANRADFNGALAQMMIGLLQTCSPEGDEIDWLEDLEKPPDADDLKKWFLPVSEAFVLNGDKARFMQDMTMHHGAVCAIDALLIDMAGSSSGDKNTDLFIKRNTVEALCPHCAALALLTLQTNAPAGGAGHRTSLRGGGPLTTLIIETPSRSLWQDLWLNVRPQQVCMQQSGDQNKTELHFIFPWMKDINQIQPAGTETQPIQVHPHHFYWAMPRRIRLDFDDVREGQCDICKRTSTQLLHRYTTRPQGLNYKGAWKHPFSPYYQSKEEWLPVHPQPGGFSYKFWLAWVLGSTGDKRTVRQAEVVNYFLRERKKNSGTLRLWVFGYDMDNMKARCWYETRFPLFALDEVKDKSRNNIQVLVQLKIEAAEQALFYLRQAVRQAWFGEGDARGNFSFIDKIFWDSTEQAFYHSLKQLIQQAGTEKGINLDDDQFIIESGTSWLKTLNNAAEKLFNFDLVVAGPIDQQDPRRIAEAYKGMRRNLDGGAIKKILRLPVQEKEIKAKKNKKS